MYVDKARRWEAGGGSQLLAVLLRLPPAGGARLLGHHALALLVGDRAPPGRPVGVLLHPNLRLPLLPRQQREGLLLSSSLCLVYLCRRSAGGMYSMWHSPGNVFNIQFILMSHVRL